MHTVYILQSNPRVVVSDFLCKIVCQTLFHFFNVATLCFVSYRFGSKTGGPNAANSRRHRRASQNQTRLKKPSLPHPHPHPPDTASLPWSVVPSPTDPWTQGHPSGAPLLFHQSMTSWTETVVCKGEVTPWAILRQPLTHIRITVIPLIIMVAWTISTICSFQSCPTKWPTPCPVYRIRMRSRWRRMEHFRDLRH